jgi:hypothetical protein
MKKQSVDRPRKRSFSVFRSGKILVRWGIPPPPPSESLDWRGFCKNGPQNLEGKELRGQNLENKGLTSFFEIGVCAASALAMFYFPGCGLQGQMSHEECGRCGFRDPNPLAKGAKGWGRRQ